MTLTSIPFNFQSLNVLSNSTYISPNYYTERIDNCTVVLLLSDFPLMYLSFLMDGNKKHLNSSVRVNESDYEFQFLS